MAGHNHSSLAAAAVPVMVPAVMVRQCDAWLQYHLSWPVVLLLAVPVGGVYANLAMCVGLRQDRAQWGGTNMAYPYLLSLACGDILNCMLVMPTAVINTFLGEFPGEVYLCRAWLAGDLCLTAAMGLHLLMLSLDLCLTLSRGGIHQQSCFTTRSQACVVAKILLTWLLAVVTALGPLTWHYVVEGDGCCVPVSLEFSVVSSSVCYFVPVLVLLGTYVACVVMKWSRGRKQAIRARQHQEDTRRQQEIENLKQVVHNFTSLSADLDIASVLTSDKEDNQKQELVQPEPPQDEEGSEKFGTGLTRKLSSLSRRLSSRRQHKPETPSSPKLDRHPSLRYSIKRGTPSMGGSQKRRDRGSMRGSQRRHGGGEEEGPGCTVPLLLATGDAGSAAMSAESSVGEDRTPEELDDQTICDMLLADTTPTGASGCRRGGSKRSSKRRAKKGSLSTLPSSPTLDRHPSLRYSIKRPHTPSCDDGPGGRRGGSFNRSPSTRSQRSFFSRTPSQRSNVSRTPSQRSFSQRSPFTRSPQALKTSPLLTDSSHSRHPVTAHATIETVFTFPEHAAPIANSHNNLMPGGPYEHTMVGIGPLQKPEIETQTRKDSPDQTGCDNAQEYTAGDVQNHIPNSTPGSGVGDVATSGDTKCLSPGSPPKEEAAVRECEDRRQCDNCVGGVPGGCEAEDGEDHKGEVKATALQSPVLVVQTATPTKCLPAKPVTPILPLHNHNDNNSDPKGNHAQCVTTPLCDNGATDSVTDNTGCDRQEGGQEAEVAPPASQVPCQVPCQVPRSPAHSAEDVCAARMSPVVPPCINASPHCDVELEGGLARAHSIESLEVVTSCSDQGENLRKTSRLLGVLTVCFTLTHLPSFITLITHSVCHNASPRPAHCMSPHSHALLYFIVQWLAYLCSLLNPIVFFAFHRHLINRLRYC